MSAQIKSALIDGLVESEKDIAEFMTPLQADAPTPIGYHRHVVSQGESLSTLAPLYGHFWQTIWMDSHNAVLRGKRKTEDVLLPEDVVFVPELRIKQETVGTDQTHRFRKKGIPVKLTMRFDGLDGQAANRSFVLSLDTGEVISGELDMEGVLDVAIKPNTRYAEVTIGTGLLKRVYSYGIGRLDPVDTVWGVQARLNNLGFNCGEVSGQMNAETRHALARFQESEGLTPNGEADMRTREALASVHGS
jgi:hypothetical protein